MGTVKGEGVLRTIENKESIEVDRNDLPLVTNLNHFIEVGVTPKGNYAFTIHCGSRNFGLKVWKYWNNIANSEKLDKNELREKIDILKSIVDDKTKLPELISKLREELESKLSPAGYLTGQNMIGYITDVVITQAYAKFNHKLIADKILAIFKKVNNAKVVDYICSIHNYIDPEDHIIRKGAVRSYLGERLVIPFNMRDGLAICEGKSNEDWNFTAPHGSGRIMSRSKAKENLKMEDYEKQMSGIYSTSICMNTLDESPGAYKDTEEIVKLIEPTCKILFMIKPVINIKSTSEGE